MDIPDAIVPEVAFAIACFVEDTEKELRKNFIPKDSPAAKRCANLEKFRLLYLTPSALCGPLTLATGEVIRPGQEYKP